MTFTSELLHQAGWMVYLTVELFPESFICMSLWMGGKSLSTTVLEEIQGKYNTPQIGIYKKIL